VPARTVLFLPLHVEVQKKAWDVVFHQVILITAVEAIRIVIEHNVERKSKFSEAVNGCWEG
jgi:hypothetical protein